MNIENLVSIIIPTYNRPVLLKRAIQSILNQTYQNFEILVIDNCIENRVENIVIQINDKRIKYYFNSTRGPSSARNYGLSVAKGKYIAFLDDDDEYIPDKLEKQMNYLYPNTDIYWTYGAGKIISKNDIVIYRPKYKFCSTFLIGVYCQILMPSILFRSECFKKDDLFDDTMFFAEDWDLWYRISTKFKVKATSDLVYIVHCEHEEKRLTENEKIIEGFRRFKQKHYYKLNLFQKILYSVKNGILLNKLSKVIQK